ncbi:hypothetical protein [Halorussus halobius]|uniref:hypothetical protein n=1 Tax=Halorussus halobius TaxID=1710537 RepID=UPI0010931CAE|nr:hypothetical protein [Halorussus halobius]
MSRGPTRACSRDRPPARTETISELRLDSTGWFWSYAQFAEYDSGPDGGLVRLVFEGDPDGLVAAESDRWDEFDGLASWRVRRYDDEGYDSLLEQQRDAKGEIGGEWEYRAKPLAARFALAYRREFGEPLPAVGDDRDGNPIELGFWAVLHDLFVQCGYDWYDETTACRKMLRNRLKSIASYRGADAAREEYEQLLAEWRAHGDALERWLDENPTGNATEP